MRATRSTPSSESWKRSASSAVDASSGADDDASFAGGASWPSAVSTEHRQPSSCLLYTSPSPRDAHES
eukprot:2793782-Prymnesium_polylepis.1